MARKRIGELLLENGAISPTQLEAGLTAQRTTRQRLGVTLIQQQAITEEQLVKVLSQALSTPTVELATTPVEWAAVHVLRARFCEQHEVFPYAFSGEPGKGRKQLQLAMTDPLNVAAIEEVEFTTGLKVLARIATHSDVRSAILRYYHKVPMADSSTGPVEVIQRGGAVVQLERAPSIAPTPTIAPTVAPVQTPVDAPAPAPEEEELILVGEMVADEPPAPEVGSDERSALAELIAAREAAQRAQRKNKGAPTGLRTAVADDLDYLFGAGGDLDPVEDLERKFWALMRIMAKKGLISREEFMREVEGEGGTK